VEAGSDVRKGRAACRTSREANDVVEEELSLWNRSTSERDKRH